MLSVELRLKLYSPKMDVTSGTLNGTEATTLRPVNLEYTSTGTSVPHKTLSRSPEDEDEPCEYLHHLADAVIQSSVLMIRSTT